jgi:hypothetical protein
LSFATTALMSSFRSFWVMKSGTPSRSLPASLAWGSKVQAVFYPPPPIKMADLVVMTGELSAILNLRATG